MVLASMPICNVYIFIYIYICVYVYVYMYVYVFVHVYVCMYVYVRYFSMLQETVAGHVQRDIERERERRNGKAEAVKLLRSKTLREQIWTLSCIFLAVMALSTSIRPPSKPWHEHNAHEVAQLGQKRALPFLDLS